jgi:O-glycosyl hydrolase
MSSSTLTASTFTLSAAGTAVTGTVSYSNLVATFTPSANLAFSTQYTATITTGAQDSAGTALASNYTWTFTTAAAPVPPTVTAVTPLSGAIGVAPNTTVTAAFSQAMTSTTITTSTFTLADAGGNAVSGIVTYAATGSMATFTPSANLAYSTTYTATITTGVQDSTGTELAQPYTWTFTTAAATQPPVPPTVTAVTPIIAATGVAINTTVTATFSQPMTASTITSATFTLADAGGNAVPGTVTYTATGSIATFTPSANLANFTTYNATITTGVQDSSGTALAANDTWKFTTIAALPPANPPSVVTPTAGATGVAVTTTLTATFNQSMMSSTINSSTFNLATTTGSTPVTGTVTFNASTSVATFTPSTSLAANTQYTATLTTGVQNLAGAPLAANYTWNFTTGAASPDQATVNFTDTLQTIRGFGGSTAWLGQMPAAVATALFSPTKGLGLSILRVRIDPTGSPSTANPYETGEWDYEAANGKLAVANNPNAIVFATPWTPPATWKLAGTTTTLPDGSSYNEAYYNGSCGDGVHYCGGYLDPNHYADYASYLEDFVSFFNTTNGFDLYAISMQNEPEENVSYESCVWDPQQMDNWVAGNASTITTDKYSTKLIMPESDDFNPDDASPTLSDINAEGQVSIIGGHIYQVLFGGSIAPYSIPAIDTPKEVWMTEFGPLSSSAPTWNQALTTYAEAIHDSLVVGQYNAFVWWGAFGDSTGNCATAAGTCGLVDNSGNVTVTGEVMGQYSKFIQPGYVHVGLTTSTNQDPNVLISAFTGTENSTQHYVIVVINADTTAVTQGFTLQNGAVTSLTPYQSTATASLAAQPAVSVTNGQFTYTLPAQSITTFVQ